MPLIIYANHELCVWYKRAVGGEHTYYRDENNPGKRQKKFYSLSLLHKSRGFGGLSESPE